MAGAAGVGFEQLDFIYTPSADVAAERDYFERVLGARATFSIEAYGTRVAMLELGDGPPAVLLADHVEGERPILVYRVADIEVAMTRLEARGWKREPQFGIPHGPCCSFTAPGGHRLAIYQLTRPKASEHFAGRRDF